MKYASDNGYYMSYSTLKIFEPLDFPNFLTLEDVDKHFKEDKSSFKQTFCYSFS